MKEKEFNLLKQLSHSPHHSSQRELAQKVGISLGLLNLVLRNLILKGYVKTKTLNKKRIQYLLTPKGVIHVIKKSYQSTINTIHHYQELENKIISLLSHYIESGYQQFFLYGDGELAVMVHRVVKNHFDTLVLLEELDTQTNNQTNTVVLNLTGDQVRKIKGQVVNLAEYLKN